MGVWEGAHRIKGQKYQSSVFLKFFLFFALQHFFYENKKTFTQFSFLSSVGCAPDFLQKRLDMRMPDGSRRGDDINH